MAQAGDLTEETDAESATTTDEEETGAEGARRYVTDVSAPTDRSLMLSVNTQTAVR